MNPNDTAEPADPDPGSGLCRLRLDLSYDGGGFSGWARQPERRTVQGLVEDALQTILRSPEPLPMTVAGRTDAGVHATGQVAHVDVRPPVEPDRLLRQLNGLLPDDVAVRAVGLAAAGFDARFSAVGRRYAYRVVDGVPEPLRRHDTLSRPRPLDTAAMAAAARPLVGEHDFAAYCRPREGATTVRTLRRLDVDRGGDGVVTIAAEADAFCRSQVRAMVGALLTVGEGRRPPEWPEAVLRSGVRDATLPFAPAHGLTLIAVDYPPDELLDERARVARQRRQLTR